MSPWTLAAVIVLLARLIPLQAPDPLRFVVGAPEATAIRYRPISDGIGRETTRAGRRCLETRTADGHGYLYFDVRRAALTPRGHAPYRLALTVEYLDAGTDMIGVQYDAVGNDVASNFRTVTWRKEDTGTWRTRTVVLEDAEMRNAQQGEADLRIGAVADGDEAIAGISLSVLDAAPNPPPRPTVPERALPTPDEVRIALDAVAPQDGDGPESVRMARAALAGRLAVVGARTAPGGVRLVTGIWREAWASRHPRTARLVRRLAADPRPFARRDGFVICVERAGTRPVVCAVGLEAPGAVFAIGALQTRALRDRGRPGLLLPRIPQPETPALDRRELYLNIGYGLRRPGITVEDWSDARWREFVDALALSGYNAWSFFLWGDGETLHPASGNAALNRRVHERLRRAIAYSHRRGLKVGMQLAPTIVPVALWEKRPDLRAHLEYVYPGVLCPSRPEAVRIMREVHAPEVRWFADCDFFSLWFYDVGGCFCETCRVPERQMASLLEQVQAWSAVARAANPKAGFQVMAWAIWRYEAKHRYSIRAPFVAALKARFAGRPLEIADGTMVDPGTRDLFGTIRGAGIPAVAFLYQTNIETGQPFPIVQSRYLRRNVDGALRAGARSAFLMRMEAGTRLADDAVAGRFLWNPRVDTGEALLSVSRQLTGDAWAARRAADALLRIDDFSWFGYVGGGADAARGAKIAELARSAVASSPASLRPGLEWLRASGDGYRILGAAAAARDAEDDAALESLDREFTASMRRSPLLRAQMGDAPYWRALFLSSLVRFFHGGWSGSPF